MLNARQSSDDETGSEVEDTGHSGAQQQKEESAGVLQTKVDDKERDITACQRRVLNSLSLLVV
jgi:hypothetical protein